MPSNTAEAMSLDDFEAARNKVTAQFRNRVDLKAISISERNSQETLSFTCSVYVDGRRIVSAANAGRGGPNEYYTVGDPSTDDFAANRSKWQSFVAEVQGFGAANGIRFEAVDGVIDDILSEKQDEKKTLKEVWFRTDDMPPGQWSCVKWPELAALWRSKPDAARGQFRTYGETKGGWFLPGQDVAFLNDTVAERLRGG